ncbi:MAG: carbohydrate ABC transporter permease [Treponema sp.]|jgi:ABC-type glycerol-3-phosphate transport system permease component|nr:carbohydrate ABC transporter permease [Treponema sp.]
MSFDKPDKGERRIALAARVVLIAAMAVLLYPIVFVILTSLKATSEFYVNIWGLPSKWMFSNYAEAWIRGSMGQYFSNSIVVVCVTVTGTLLLGAMAGYALSRFRIPCAELIMLAIIACTMIPSEAVIMPEYLIISRMKMTGRLVSLILPYIGWSLPMAIFIFRNFFNTLPGELMEAAQIDGCNEWTTFIKIAVPITLPAIATNAIFIFVGTWGELLWATVELASSIRKTLPIGVIAFSAQFGTEWGPMSAAICIVLLPLVIFFLFTQKYFIGGLTGGAVKG